jgi:apolipoprotein N-acyltransferase
MMSAGHKLLRWSACLVAAIASGVLIASGFAPWENVTTSWAGLVPLLLICRFRPAREAFGWGFLSGAITWLTGLHWLMALQHTADLPLAAIGLGWIALSLYCALYTALFAWAVARWLAWTGTDRLLRNVGTVLVIPIFWVGLEYLRSILFTGFPWNPLGATQAQNPAIAQVAEWGGVYLVSGILVLFNTSIAFTVARYLDWRNKKKYRPHVELFVGLTVMAVCTVWGRSRFQQVGSLGGNVLVGIVQPAVAQTVKFDADFANVVQDRLTKLTFEAAETGQVLAKKRPDLVIWPETSTTGDLATEGEYRDMIAGLSSDCGPLLLGALHEEEDFMANSAILVNTNGSLGPRYDKQHLVPFGEFIPLDKRFTALQAISPLGISLTPGREATVFDLPGTAVRFSVTICFEDIFPNLSREFVRGGARLLINQSNDAWFDGTSQHRQHLNMSIMRCIENRVPGVRVSNSGSSGFIEANGRVYHTGLAASDDGWLGVPGPLADGKELSDVSLVDPPPAGMQPTCYTRFGDWVLAIPCAAVVLVWMAAAWWMAKRRPDQDDEEPIETAEGE